MTRSWPLFPRWFRPGSFIQSQMEQNNLSVEPIFIYFRISSVRTASLCPTWSWWPDWAWWRPAWVWPCSCSTSAPGDSGELRSVSLVRRQGGPSCNDICPSWRLSWSTGGRSWRRPYSRPAMTTLLRLTGTVCQVTGRSARVRLCPGGREENRGEKTPEIASITKYASTL